MDSTLAFWVIGFLAGIVAGLVFLLLTQKRGGRDGKTGNDLLLLQSQISDLKETLDTRLGESNREMRESMNSQFNESAKIIREVTTHLTKLDDTNRQVMGFAEGLQALQDILKNPKQRGTLGEYYLETVLANVLPPRHYQMQYSFIDGKIVDAALFLDGGKILPVDSKFSLENYNKLLEASDEAERTALERSFRTDVKTRIDETSKYIRPNEGTMDFAFMFIPSEAIYYDLLINQIGGRDLLEYAFQKRKVIVVSPTSFMAYLQTVLQGLRSLEIEESAKEIRKHVEKLGDHIKAHETYMQKLGAALGTTVNHFNAAHKELSKMDKDVYKITEESPGVEPVTLERPKTDD